MRNGFTYLASWASVYTLAKSGGTLQYAETSRFACWGMSPIPVLITEIICGCAPFRRLLFFSLVLMGSSFLLIQIEQPLCVGLVDEQVTLLFFELVVFGISEKPLRFGAEAMPLTN